MASLQYMIHIVYNYTGVCVHRFVPCTSYIYTYTWQFVHFVKNKFRVYGGGSGDLNKAKNLNKIKQVLKKNLI